MATSASATPPSCPSSENEAKPHPYQQFDEGADENGPRGAFEVKKVNSGLYVRVDMPGVPNDGVKVVKYNDSRTLTFTGKSAAVSWPHFDDDDTSSRIYAGYVALDRDPALVDVTSCVINGVLRLFFPHCDGSLHFLSPKLQQLTSHHSHHDSDENYDEEDNSTDDDPNLAFIVHAPHHASGIRLVGGKPEHINPYLLSGAKEVYEHKIVNVEGKQLIYVRVDVPGSSYRSYNIIENDDRAIGFTALGAKDSPYDEGGREYFGSLAPSCNCCRYRVVDHEVRDGVLRFLVCKSENLDSTPVCHCILPPLKPGGPLRPSVLALQGLRVPSFESKN